MPGPNDPIDPNRALRMAIEELRDSLNKANEFQQVQNSPNYQIRMAREKAAVEGRMIARGGQVISQAEPQPQIGPDPELHEPSEAPDAEDLNVARGRGRRQFYDKRERDEARQRERETEASGEGGDWGNLEKKTKLKPKQLEAIAQEPLTIPQYQWRLDEQLRIARDTAIKIAQKAADPESRIPGSLQGPAESVAGVLQKGYQYAAPLEWGQRMIKGAIHQAYGGQELGASLGYSPQTGIGGAYIAGIRNPLAAFTSEAGRQGLGQKVGALSAMFGGGISLGQAEGLRGALSQEGFSNQKEGAAGLYTGGENEVLAEALEPSVKEGLSPEIAAGFANVTRYGTGGVRGLRESLEGLGHTARTLKLGIDQTADSMQKFAEQQEASGATPLHSNEAYKTIAGATGVVPTKIAEIGESPLGIAQQVRAGYFPGTLGAQSGAAQVNVAKKTIDQAMKYVHGHTTYTTNEKGEREVSAESEENAIAIAAQIFHLNPQMIHLFKEHGPQIEASTKALQKIGTRRQELERIGPYDEAKWIEHHPHEGVALGHAEKQLKENEEWLKRAEHEYNKGGEKEIQQAGPEMEKAKEWIRRNKEEVDMHRSKFAKQGHNISEKEGKKDWAESWHEAAKAGVSAQEGKEAIHTGHNWQEHLQALYGKVSEKNQIKGAEEEGKGIIELSPEARKFFKLKFPNATKEEANAGGTSQSQNAAAPNQKSRYPEAEAIIKGATEKAETIVRKANG